MKGYRLPDGTAGCCYAKSAAWARRAADNSQDSGRHLRSAPRVIMCSLHIIERDRGNQRARSDTNRGIVF